MNIREAIRQTELALRAYAARDAQGSALIPTESQRPIYLLGAPGVGKTAAAEEVARRLGVGLVSYTLTHHTRQSALGLPQLVARTFAGRETMVTEYTMSEIIAGIYRYREQTGHKRGTLFLDESTCVSETLLPAIMELLQHKRFGEHRVPDGWMIVCAGNPEQYNRSARAFDPVAMDRVRVLRVEPDLSAWLEYAAEAGVSAVIRSYLRLSPGEFYRIEADGAITPRSWTDLSQMIFALEALGEAPDETLFEQYLQCPEVCRRFALYEKMCRSAAGAMDLNAVLEGDFSASDEMRQKPFEEALFAAELLADRVVRESAAADIARESAVRLSQFADGAHRSCPAAENRGNSSADGDSRESAVRLSQFADGARRSCPAAENRGNPPADGDSRKSDDAAREAAAHLDQSAVRRSGANLLNACREQLARREHALDVRKSVGGLSEAEENRERALLNRIRDCISSASAAPDFAAALDAFLVRAHSEADEKGRLAAKSAQNALDFMENAFPRRVQIVMLSELMHNERAARFLRRNLPERIRALEGRLNPEAIS